MAQKLAGQSKFTDWAIGDLIIAMIDLYQANLSKKWSGLIKFRPEAFK